MLVQEIPINDQLFFATGQYNWYFIQYNKFNSTTSFMI